MQGSIEALAIDANRIAYDVGSTTGKANNKVLVWNARTGKTTTVSGRQTTQADESSTGSGVFELAIAGTRVAWLMNVGGNLEGDDYLFTSSVTAPRERQVAMEQRLGENCPGRSQPGCAGEWLGGLVGSGNVLAVNRWTTDGNGALADGGLYLISGTQLERIGGVDTVQAVAADGGRVVTLSPDGTVNMYSSAGTFLRTFTPSSARAVALSGHNLVVLTRTGTIELFYAPSDTLSKSFPVHGKSVGNLDVQRNLAIYTSGDAVHAVNLGNENDRVIGKLRGGIGLARIGTGGVVYTNNRLASKGTLVFVPWARVQAAVR
ncbi:MAG TPA: hypothetical protein VJ814_08690 [Gaiellaceae bacterium]|nr:hypothetical protein [Gaiellaceae bacterium]